MIDMKCPKCGAALVERINRESGESFLGCAKWPDCTYTRPIPEDVQMRRAGQQGLPGFGE